MILTILITSFFAALSLFMVVPFLMIHLTSSGMLTLEQAGLVVGISFWIKRGGALPGGMAADRFGRRLVMITALSIRLPGYLLLAYGRSFLPLLLGSALVSAGSAFYMPAAKSALTVLTPLDSRVRIFALRAGAVNTGAAIGPLIGAVLLDYSSKTLFLTTAALFTIVTIVNAMLRLPDASKTSVSSLSLALSVVKAPNMLHLMLFGVLFFLAYIQTETIFSIFVKRSGYAHLIGPLFGFWAAAVVVSQIALSRFILAMSRSACVLIGFAAFACGFVLLHEVGKAAHVPIVFGFFAATALFSVGEVILDLRLDYDASLVPADRVGTSFGFINIACGLGGLIGSSLGTFAYDNLSSSGWPIRSAWLLMALLSALSVPILMRHRPPTPDMDASEQK